jgi:hypothetical protein
VGGWMEVLKDFSYFARPVVNSFKDLGKFCFPSRADM